MDPENMDRASPTASPTAAQASTPTPLLTGDEIAWLSLGTSKDIWIHPLAGQQQQQQQPDHSMWEPERTQLEADRPQGNTTIAAEPGDISLLVKTYDIYKDY